MRLVRRVAAVSLALVLPAAFGIACGPSLDPTAALAPPACDALSRTAVPDDASVILVLNDAMRRDRVGAFGGSARTPRLDAFAAEHLIFRAASSAAPWTKPAIASLFTSAHPSQHGVLTHPGAEWSKSASPETDALSDAFDTLAEVLRRTGFRTAAFVANPWMEPGFGYEQGFERYDASFARWDAPGADIVDAGLAWLSELQAHERYFLYLHTIDSHLPYGRLTDADLQAARENPDPRPLPPEAQRYVRGIRAHDGRTLFVHDVPASLGLIETAYDRGIEAFDQALGQLLDAADTHPALARAAVIVTSDHGEALFERGYGNHARALLQDELAIPLVARLPGVEPERASIDCPIGLVDLMATFCHYLGVRCPDGLAGRSFLRGGPEAKPRYVVSEGVPRFPDHRAVRSARYKLVHAPGGPSVEGLGLPDMTPDRPDALYDLATDPAETRDLLAARFPGRDARKIARLLRRGLERDRPREDARPTRAPLNADAQERLRALGYLDE